MSILNNEIIFETVMISTHAMQLSIGSRFESIQQKLNHMLRETSTNSRELENASLVVTHGEKEVYNFENSTGNEFDNMQGKIY